MRAISVLTHITAARLRALRAAAGDLVRCVLAAIGALARRALSRA